MAAVPLEEEAENTLGRLVAAEMRFVWEQAACPLLSAMAAGPLAGIVEAVAG